MAEINDLLVDQFFSTTLSQSIDPLQNQIIYVEDASGFPAPTLGSGKYFYLTLVDGDRAEIVKIGGVVSNELTVFGGEAVVSGFNHLTARAEHWFTAQAFVDIQNAIFGLGGTVVIPPDGSTITGGAELSVALADGPGKGIITNHLNDAIVTEPKLVNNAVSTRTIQALAVLNEHLATGINANKIASISSSKLPVDTIPKITFAQIDYTVGTPIGGGDPGDIFIEWEEHVD